MLPAVAETAEEIVRYIQCQDDANFIERLKALQHVVVNPHFTYAEIARCLNVWPKTVVGWLGAYAAGGMDALLTRRIGGPPLTGQLRSPELYAFIEARLLDTDNPPLGYIELWRECSEKFKWLEITYQGFYKQVGKVFPNTRLLVPRPAHALQDPEDIEAGKKKVEDAVAEAVVEGLAAGEQGPVVLFQDEGKFGLRTETAKVLANSSIRPVVKVVLTYGCEWLFVAVNPATGCKVVMHSKKANTEAFNRHLQKISERYRGRKVVLFVDGAGWHRSKKLKTPENVKIVIIPPYCPELNPVENFWKTVKRRLKNRTFRTMEELWAVIKPLIRFRCTELVKSVCGYDWILEIINRYSYA